MDMRILHLSQFGRQGPDTRLGLVTGPGPFKTARKMSSQTGLDEAGFSSAAKAAKKKKRIKAAEPDVDNDLQELEYGPHKPLPVNQLDEIPIMKSGPSSFEELLERELAKEQAGRLASNHPSAPSSGIPVPKATFLKRGGWGPRRIQPAPWLKQHF